MNRNELIEVLAMGMLKLKGASHDAISLQELQAAVDSVADAAFEAIMQASETFSNGQQGQ